MIAGRSDSPTWLSRSGRSRDLWGLASCAALRPRALLSPVVRLRGALALHEQRALRTAVATVNTATLYGATGMGAFLDTAAEIGLNILTSIEFSPDITDHSTQCRLSGNGRDRR